MFDWKNMIVVFDQVFWLCFLAGKTADFIIFSAFPQASQVANGDFRQLPLDAWQRLHDRFGVPARLGTWKQKLGTFRMAQKPPISVVNSESKPIFW